MPRLRTINRLYDLLDEYAAVVDKTALAPSSKQDYIAFAHMFVRWVDNDFEPGKHVNALSPRTR